MSMQIPDEMVEAFWQAYEDALKPYPNGFGLPESADRHAIRAALSAALTEPRVLRMAAEVLRDRGKPGAAGCFWAAMDIEKEADRG